MGSSSTGASPLVTTIIPTFQRPRLLKRAILSALEQEGVSLKVCVFDNASADDTSEVVASLAIDDSRLLYHRHDRNLGATDNFEFGFNSVDTQYFSVLSDDDYLLPNFYKHAINDLARNPEAMFWAGITLNVAEEKEIWDARGAGWAKEGLHSPPNGMLSLMHGNAPVWTGIVFRSELLVRIGLPDREALGPSDLDFLLRSASRFPFILRKIPAAVFSLNPSSYSATEPLSSFWPGWKRMFSKIQTDVVLSAPSKVLALAALRNDATRMLFRRGANAIAKERYDFALEAARALNVDCGRPIRSILLRSIATLCKQSIVAQRVYTNAYEFAERRIVRSRSAVLAPFKGLVRPV